MYHHVTARHTHTSGDRYFRHLQVGPNVYAIGNPFDLDQILTTGMNLPGVLICQAEQHHTNYKSTGLLPRSIFVGGDNQIRVPVTLQSTP